MTAGSSLQAWRLHPASLPPVRHARPAALPDRVIRSVLAQDRSVAPALNLSTCAKAK